MQSSQVFPESVLTSERLTLRRFQSQDASGVAAAMSDELSARWLTPDQPYTLQDATAWCVSIAPGIREQGAGIHWAAIEKESSQFVGLFGFNAVDWKARSAEVAYAVHPAMRGRGFATEAVVKLTDWLLQDQGFTRCQLRVAAGNRGSQKVAIAAGFTPEGILRQAGFTHHGNVDLVAYSRLADDQ